MKRIFSIVFVLSFFLEVSAQKSTYLINESFENGAKGWTRSSSCGGEGWGFMPDQASKGIYSARLWSFTAGCKSLLISPAITPGNYSSSDSVYLSFDFYRSQDDPSGTDYMYTSIVSSDGTKTLAGPYEYDRYYQAYPYSNSAGWITYTQKWPVKSILDANGKFKLSFQGIGSGRQDMMYLDNVRMTIGAPPVVINLSYKHPVKGEYLYHGEHYKINWVSNSADTMAIKVISTDGTSTLASGSGKLSDSSFSFTVPYSSKTDFNAVITDLVTGDVFTSDTFHVIKPLALVSPSGGETFYWGQSATVNWTSSGAGSVDLYLKTSDSVTIDSWKATSADNAYNIIIPSVPKAGAFVEAVDEITGQVVNSAAFTISKPEITFLRPLLEQFYTCGDIIPIKWTGTGITQIKPNAMINLQMVDTTGSVIQNIASGIAYAAGSYSWTTPAIAGTYLIQATFFDSAINQTLKYNSAKVILQPNTGLLENSIDAEMNVFPNPSGGAFTIQLKDAATEPDVMAVYSMDGKEVIQQKINTGDKFIHAELYNLKGLFTIYIRTNNAVMHSQIMLIPYDR
jgi:hypothetical protein